MDGGEDHVGSRYTPSSDGGEADDPTDDDAISAWTDLDERDTVVGGEGYRLSCPAGDVPFADRGATTNSEEDDDDKG